LRNRLAHFAVVPPTQELCHEPRVAREEIADNGLVRPARENSEQIARPEATGP